MLAKIVVLVFIILFIQQRPQGLFALQGPGGGGVSTPRTLAPAMLARRLRRRLARAAGRHPRRRVVLLVLVPVLHLAVPASSALHVSDYLVTLVGKIMCYAIVALAMDLIWGYTGILASATASSSRSAATRWACT